MDRATIGLAIFLLFGTMLSSAAEGAIGSVTTVLDAPLSAAATTMTVTSTTNFRSSGQLLVDEELIDYTGVTATTFTGLSRGREDTDAKAHTAGVTVSEATIGLVVSMLDFRVAQSDVPVFGPLVTGFNMAVTYVMFLGRALTWDYSYWDQDILGIPMRLGQLLMFGISLGVIFRIFVILRNGGGIL